MWQMKIKNIDMVGSLAGLKETTSQEAKICYK